MQTEMQPMDEQKRRSARYRISERDYFRAMLLHARPTWRIGVVLVMALIIEFAAFDWHLLSAGLKGIACLLVWLTAREFLPHATAIGRRACFGAKLKLL